MMWIIILFVGGILFIASEFILPGLIMGILGFFMVLGSVFLAWAEFPEYGLLIALGEFAAMIVTLIGGFWVMTNTPAKKLVVMDGVQRKEDGYSGPSQDPNLVGQTAIAHTPLRPAGILTLDNQRIDAVSDGTYIEAGSSVRIVQVEGNRVVVEEAQEDADKTA